MSVTIQSVNRALSILDLLATHPDGLTVRAIASKVSLHVSTTHHLVRTLEAKEYALRLPAGSYRLGSAVPRLYRGFVRSYQAERSVLERLHSLARATGETTYAADWQNGSVVIQAIVEGHHALRVGGLHVGFGEHAHARASGKTLLAHLPDDELGRFLSSRKLARLTPNTVHAPRELRAQLRRIAAHGYAVDREEYAEGVCCVAAPVFSAEGKPVAALAISAPARRFAANEKRLIQAVVRAARQASASLGFAPSAGRRRGAGSSGGRPLEVFH